jgi:hypothetical protein
MLLVVNKLERCLSTAGGYRTVLPLPCLLFLVVLAHGFDMMPPVHSEVLSSVVNMLHALRGLFFLVDMLLPVVHSAVTSPFVAFFLLLLLSLSVVEFLVLRSVQSAPSLLSSLLDLLVVLKNPLLWCCRC